MSLAGAQILMKMCIFTVFHVFPLLLLISFWFTPIFNYLFMIFPHLFASGWALQGHKSWWKCIFLQFFMISPVFNDLFMISPHLFASGWAYITTIVLTVSLNSFVNRFYPLPSARRFIHMLLYERTNSSGSSMFIINGISWGLALRYAHSLWRNNPQTHMLSE